MSSALGIASVTHVLKDLLNDGLINHDVTSALGSAIGVSSLPPGTIETGGGDLISQLNIFMYRVTPNIGWTNVGYPSRNGRGDIVNNPFLALDLHYLLTAFGDSELHAEILLGYGMQILHENPVLIRREIRTSLSTASIENPGGRLPANLIALATSDLAEQIEQIKITNEHINTEELSRLWTAFQTRYRPCTAYKATVVLIESDKSTSSPLPVQERKFFVLPFKQPIIEKVQPLSHSGTSEVSNQRITVGQKIVIHGKQLKKEGLIILINGEPFTQDTDDILTDIQVSIEVPGTLKAGVLGVQIAHPVMINDPPEPRRGAESNLLSFVLSPIVSNPSVTILTSTGDDILTADLTLNVNPGVRRGQRVILLLNDLDPSSGEDPKSYSFQLPASFLANEENAVSTLIFPIRNVKESLYLVRIQVDGAESPLSKNTDGEYDSPFVKIED